METRRIGPSALRILGGLTALVILSVSIGACSKAGPDAAQAATSTAVVGQAIPEVLATIGTEQVTLQQVRERLGGELDRLETEFQRHRSKAIEAGLEKILQERILGEEAKKNGKTIEQLVLAEAGGSFEPSPIEISTWYQDNQGRVGGRPLDQVSTQIAELLRNQKRAAAQQKLGARLNKEHNVAIKFEPYRLAFNNTGAATIGKSDAKVKVVEFSDFQCPFCKQFAPTLKQIAEKFGDKVEVIYRQYPIPSLHPYAIKAAEASLCAKDQGKFWELHDLMFSEQDRLAVTDLKEKARRLGLDEKKFNSCLDTGRYTEQVQNDANEAQKSGITGTPAVFVNGLEVPGGAVPYEKVAKVIQAELDRTSK